MATTTAAITLTSTDLTSDSLSLSSTATLTKAGVATGLDQTTGVARKFYATASNNVLIKAADLPDGQQKVYIKNTSSSDSETVQIELGATQVMGKLSGGDWAFFPWDGATDIEVTTSAVNMTVEYMVIFEA